MHNILNRNYAVRDLNFTSLRPNPNRYKYAYREICFRTNCEFSSATPIQTNRPEKYGQQHILPHCHYQTRPQTGQIRL